VRLSTIISGCDLKAVKLIDDTVEISSVYTSDLLSDVMAHCPDESILITVQNHANTIAVATLVGARAIVVVHNRPLPEDMQTIAEREGISLLSSQDDQFTLSCRIGALLGCAH